jgi:hypothetical protein
VKEEGNMDLPVTSEVVFNVIREDIGGYVAVCSSEDISVMAHNWEDLRRKVKAAVERHLQDGPKPVTVRLHLVRDEIISLE